MGGLPNNSPEEQQLAGTDRGGVLAIQPQHQQGSEIHQRVSAGQLPGMKRWDRFK